MSLTARSGEAVHSVNENSSRRIARCQIFIVMAKSAVIYRCSGVSKYLVSIIHSVFNIQNIKPTVGIAYCKKFIVSRLTNSLSSIV